MPVSLGELAVRFGCELHGDPEARVDRVATLQDASSGAVTFLANSKYRKHLRATRATVVVLDEASVELCPTNALVAGNPYATYARIAQYLNPEPEFTGGRHPSAVIEPDASVDPSAWIGPHCYVGAGAVIGRGVYLGPGTVVLAGARVGAHSRDKARPANSGRAVLQTRTDMICPQGSCVVVGGAGRRPARCVATANCNGESAASLPRALPAA